MRKQPVVLWSVVLFALLAALVLTLVTTRYFAVAQGPRIEYGETVDGQIDTANAVDNWIFEGISGDVVAINISRTDGNLLPSVTLADPDGNLLLSVHWPQAELADIVLTVNLRTTGPYTLGVQADSATTGAYELSVALEQAGTLEDGILAYGKVVSGEITDIAFQDIWNFRGLAGDVVDVMMMATSGDLDTFLSLVSPQGEVLASSDSGGSGTDAALFAVRLPSTGNYSIVARRAGDRVGEAGTTSGTYDLSLILRTPGIEGGRVTPITLARGIETRGRLNADATAALFSVEAEGVLTLAFDTVTANQISRLSIMTPTGVLLDTFAGMGAMSGNVTLPEPGTYMIEVLAEGIRETQPVDFALTVDQLTTAQRAAYPLQYDQPQTIMPTSNQPEAWYFYGQNGDLVTLEIWPVTPLLEGSELEIYGPDGRVLVNRTVRDAFRQTLELSVSGQHEIILDSTAWQAGYHIVVRKHGIDGLAYRQHTEPQPQGHLRPGPGETVMATLDAGEAHTWEINASQAENWQFQLRQTGTDVPLGIAVEAASGEWLAVKSTKRLTNAAWLPVSLPTRGNYRVLVFDPTGTTPHDYMLWGGPTDAGRLTLNSRVKGVLDEVFPVDRWQLDVPVHTLLNVDMTLVEGTTTPDMYIIQPDGQVIATNRHRGLDNTLQLVGVSVERGGQYELVITQAPNARRTVYQIEASIVQPFTPVMVIPEPTTDAPVETYETEVKSAGKPKRVRVAEQVTPFIRPDADFLANSKPISFEDLIPGEMPEGQMYQSWQFSANANQLLGFSVVALENQGRPDIVILDDAGSILAENYQESSTANYLMHRFESTGTYFVVIKLASGGRYTLLVDSLAGIEESVTTVLDAHVLRYGETVYGEIAHADDQRSYVFMGKAGDSIAARVLETQGDIRLRLALQQVPGETLLETTPNKASIVAIEDYVLPTNGTYQMVVSHDGNPDNVTGRFALHLDITQSLIAERQGGKLDQQEIVSLGGNMRHEWQFSAQSGEKVTLSVEPLSVDGPSPLTLQLTDTSGTPFLQKDSALGHSALVFEDILLPRTGVYQAVVIGGRNPGVYRISLTRDAAGTQDDEWTIEYGQTSGKVLTQTNFLDVWTFVGSQNDVVTVSARVVRGDAASLNLQLRAANGFPLATAAGDATGVRLEQVTLPIDGHYSLLIGNVDGTFTGETAYEITVRLEDTQARSMGTVMAYGETVEGSFFLDDRTDTWLFNGKQGDLIIANVESRSPDLQPVLDLVSTDWRGASSSGQILILASSAASPGQAGILQFELPISGTYALVARDPAFAGGTYTLALNIQSAATGIAGSLRYGQSGDGQISAVHLRDQWTFAGSFGDRVTIAAMPDSRSMLAPVVTLISPSGQALVSQSSVAGSVAQIDAYPLPETGLYIIQVTRYLEGQGETVGRYSLDLQRVGSVDLDYTNTTYGQIQRGLLDDDSASDTWAVDGEAGDVIRVFAEATSGDLDLMLYVYDERGQSLAASDDQQGLDAELVVALPKDGRYLVDVMRYGLEQGRTQGNYVFVVEQAYQLAMRNIQGYPITYGDRVSGSVDAVQRSEIWSFAGEAGDTLHAEIEFPRDDAPLALYLVDPAGEILATGTRILGDSIIDEFTLPYSGGYALEVRRPGDARADYSPYALDLILLDTADHLTLQQGGFITSGQSLTGFFTHAPSTHDWQFEGNVGKRLSLTLTRINGNLPQHLLILTPDGTTLLYTDISPGSHNAFSTGTLELPVDGVYTLKLTGDQHVLGSVYRLSLREETAAAADIQTLLPFQDGFGLISDAQPAENWTFSAEAGDTLAVRVAAVSGNLEPTLMLWGPDNRPLWEGIHEYIDGVEQRAITRIIAPLSGEYHVTVSRAGGNLGTSEGEYRIMVRNMQIAPQAAVARDVATGTQVIDYNASASPAYYAIQGLAGEVVGISAQLVNGAAVPDLTIATEAGELLEVEVQTTATEAFVPAFVFPEDGRYIIELSGLETIGYAFTVFRRPATVSENTITRNLVRGRTLSEGVLNPAQPTIWLFSGEAGEVLNFTVDTSGGGLRADVTLYGPQGYIANAVETPGPQVELEPIRLPDDGEYRLVVGPWLGAIGGSTGQYTVRVEEAEPGISGSQGGHIAARNQVVTGGLIPEDTQDRWTFDGYAGEVVTIRAEQTYGDGAISLTVLPTETASEPSTAFLGAEIDQFVLPSTARYTIQVDGRLADSGAVEYRLTVLRDQSPLVASLVTAQGIAFGEAQTGILDNVESYDAWVFFGQAGERVTFSVESDDTTYAPEVYLLAPDSTIIAADTSLVPGSSAGRSNIALPEDGFYGIVVGGSHEGSITYAVQVIKTTAVTGVEGTLEGQPGEIVTGQVTMVAPVQHWGLAPQYSGTYLVNVRSLVSGEELDVFIQEANGELLNAGTVSGAASQVKARLDANRTYVALVSGGPAVIGTRYHIQLMPAGAMLETQTLTVGIPDVGRVNANALNNEWRVAGLANSTWAIAVNRIDGNMTPRIAIVGPNGVVLQENTGDDDGSLAASFQVPADGQYAIVVTRDDGGAGMSSGDYTIVVNAG